MKKVLVVIPTYNESENIADLVDQILAQKPVDSVLDVLVVDDASQDGTGKIVKDLMSDNSKIHLLERLGKLGLGTAYLAGFRYAMAHGYDFVATMDGDFSHDPVCLPAFMRAAQEADVVIGSRYVPGGGVRNWGIHRRLLSFCANVLARLAGGFSIRDCTTGYRLYRCDFLKSLDLERIVSHGYSCLIELVFVSTRHGARIVESPIIFRDRRAGQSKISHHEIMRAFSTLSHLIRRRCSSKSR